MAALFPVPKNTGPCRFQSYRLPASDCWRSLLRAFLTILTAGYGTDNTIPVPQEASANVPGYINRSCSVCGRLQTRLGSRCDSAERTISARRSEERRVG